jgi:hypothetical protein
MSDTVTRGDTAHWKCKLVDRVTGDPIDLSGYSLWLTAKSAPSNDMDDSDAVIIHYIEVSAGGAVTDSNGFVLGGIDPETGLTVAGAASGVLTETLTDEESTLLALGTYLYDVQVMTPTGEVYTPVNGQPIAIVTDITRRITIP